jgi:hypothetical protein
MEGRRKVTEIMDQHHLCKFYDTNEFLEMQNREIEHLVEAHRVVLQHNSTPYMRNFFLGFFGVKFFS